jgi:hypothetical protein
MRVRMTRVNPVTIEALRLQSEGDHVGLRRLAARIRDNRDDNDPDLDTIPVHERLTDRIRAASESSTSTSTSATIAGTDTETLVSRVRRASSSTIATLADSDDGDDTIPPPPSLVDRIRKAGAR